MFGRLALEEVPYRAYCTGMRWLLCRKWDNVVRVPLPEVLGGRKGVEVTVVHLVNVEVQQLQGKK